MISSYMCESYHADKRQMGMLILQDFFFFFLNFSFAVSVLLALSFVILT